MEQALVEADIVPTGPDRGNASSAAAALSSCASSASMRRSSNPLVWAWATHFFPPILASGEVDAVDSGIWHFFCPDNHAHTAVAPCVRAPYATVGPASFKK